MHFAERRITQAEAEAPPFGAKIGLGLKFNKVIYGFYTPDQQVPLSLVFRPYATALMATEQERTYACENYFRTGKVIYSGLGATTSHASAERLLEVNLVVGSKYAKTVEIEDFSCLPVRELEEILGFRPGCSRDCPVHNGSPESGQSLA